MQNTGMLKTESFTSWFDNDSIIQKTIIVQSVEALAVQDEFEKQTSLL